MKLRRGERRLLEIERLEGPDGVGTVGETSVRVRGALPGDRVLARIQRVQSRRRQATASLLMLEAAGVERIAPRCSHFHTCGGCIWQDVPYEEQVRIKQEAVARCLEASGIAVALDDPLPAPEPYYYRNKMEFSFGRSAEGLTEVGLHVAGRFDRVFDLEACFLQSETSNRIVDRIRAFVRERGLSAYHLKEHKGLLRFLTVREGKQTGETMVVLTTSGEELADAGRLASTLTSEFPEVKSVVHSVNRRKAQVAAGEEEHVIGGGTTVSERLGRYTFEISPGSFFQTNTLQAERLYHRVAELANPAPEDRVLDLYCGTGGISLFLSERAEGIVGVESSEAAVRDAARNGAANGVRNCSFVCGEAETVLGQMTARSERFEAAVTDPPRAGMHPKAMGGLIDLRPARIVYISCNPQALGVDLSRLEAAGYRTAYVQVVDMFPHTAHCEVIARLDDTV